MFQDLLHLFFPNTCICCENIIEGTERFICLSCLNSLPILEDKKSPVMQKLAGRVRAESALAFLKFNKLGMGQKLLHELKYNNNPALGIYLGNLFGMEIQATVGEMPIDILVPVPLHPKKQAKRGYNQSEQIAIGLSEVLQIPVNNQLLVKIKDTKSQTGKSRLSRIKDMAACYELKQGQVGGLNQRIGLVDDVITTGATFEACSFALATTQPISISVLSFAVA